MKRFIVAVVVVFVVFATGVLYAQEDGPPKMPEKVRNTLEKLIGTWSWDANDYRGIIAYKWDSQKFYVIGEARNITGEHLFGSELWGWDGISEDGIIVFNMAVSDHGSAHGKIVSDTVIEGEGTGVYGGQKTIGKNRLSFQGPDQFTIVAKGSTPEGKPTPDWKAVYTRVESDTPKPRPQTQQEAVTKSDSLLGTWELTSYKYGNRQAFSSPSENTRRLKMITDTHYIWFQIDTSTKEIQTGAGGSYSLVGDTYTESTDFVMEGMANYLDKKHAFTVRVEGDKLTQTGALSDGLKIEEVWHRVK
jgi:hypothetical protein